MDDRADLERWADALLDQHRTAPRRDREAEREAAARALKDLSPAQQRMLTHGGREPDVDLIERVKRSSRRHRTLEKWEAIFVIAGVTLLGLLALASTLPK